jgi:hypothetical protein
VFVSTFRRGFGRAFFGRGRVTFTVVDALSWPAETPAFSSPCSCSRLCGSTTRTEGRSVLPWETDCLGRRKPAFSFGWPDLSGVLFSAREVGPTHGRIVWTSRPRAVRPSRANGRTQRARSACRRSLMLSNATTSLSNTVCVSSDRGCSGRANLLNGRRARDNKRHELARNRRLDLLLHRHDRGPPRGARCL